MWTRHNLTTKKLYFSTNPLTSLIATTYENNGVYQLLYWRTTTGPIGPSIQYTTNQGGYNFDYRTGVLDKYGTRIKVW